MSIFTSIFNSEPLRKYREPTLFFGGGLLAGLFLFLLWFATRPSEEQALVSQPAATASAAPPSLSGETGILNGIAGGPEQGQAAVSDVEDAAATDDAGTADADAAPTGDAAVAEAPAAVSDEQAIADGLLPSADAEAAKPELQTWYVEVARGPGVSEVLEVNADSADQALSVVRDFRGNPKVTRGPSLQPLD